MWEEILAIAFGYGLIPAMFVGLLVYVLRDGKRREEKYQQTNEKLADALEIVQVIHEDVKELKKKAKRKQSCRSDTPCGEVVK